MSDEPLELRRIRWGEVFPFVRLLGTVRRALHPRHLLLGTAAVIACYLVGRVFDASWGWADGGVLMGSEAGYRHEIQAYVGLDSAGFRNWVDESRRSQRALATRAARMVSGGSTTQEAGDVELEAAIDRLRGGDYQRSVRELLAAIEKRVRDGSAAIQADGSLSSAAKAERLARLRASADFLRLALAGKDISRFGANERSRAVSTIAQVSSGDEGGAQAAPQMTAQIQNVLARGMQLSELERRRPGGVFITLLDWEMRCFAGAVQGVVAGRWGYGGGALDAEPSLLGSIGSAAGGVMWLVTQRPWYAIVYGLAHLAIFAFFGTAICRSAAIASARGDSPSWREPVDFACEKWLGSYFATLFPLVGVAGVALVLLIGGLVAGIPGVGLLIGGPFYFLALLGGVALALILVAYVAGFHLLLPTIAVEGSDTFDALSHAGGYVFQRAWNLAFYSLLMLIYGGLSFIAMRLVVLLSLKCTHAVTAAGLGWLGAFGSARTDTFGRLEAMWSMPSWGALSLLPATGDQAFWGEFFNAPLSWLETFGSVFIAAWVFLFVAMLGGYVVSFYFCGSTEMYLLLRRDTDGVDPSEIYYEDLDSLDDFGSKENDETGSGSVSGTALPIVNSTEGRA